MNHSRGFSLVDGLVDHRGLSLVEMLVACAIFAVVALAISGQTLFAARQNRVSEARAIAISIAEDELECRRLQRIGGVCAPAVPFGYTVTWPTSPTTSPPTFTVTVAWTTDTGGSVTISTQSM